VADSRTINIGRGEVWVDVPDFQIQENMTCGIAQLARQGRATGLIGRRRNEGLDG